MKKELPEAVAFQIETIKAEGEVFWSKKEFENVIEKNLEAWSLLPEPKGSYSESFHIARTLSTAYLELKKLGEAKKWSDILFDCATFRYDMGERDFLRGKIEYESGNEEEAFKFFKNADTKSKKRCWQGETDMKYFQFFKKK